MQKERTERAYHEKRCEVLVDGFEGAADPDVVLELDGGFVVDQGLEEAFCEQLELELGWEEYKYLKKNILKRQGALGIELWNCAARHK